MKEQIKQLIFELIKENLTVEIVEWYSDTFSIRLFWGGVMFFESNGSSGRLQ